MPGSRVPALRVLDARDAADRRAWLAAWQAWPAREVFAHPGYVTLSATDGARPLAALLETADGTVLYPFLLRPVPVEIGDDALPAHDLTTPYGYGGPFAWDVADAAHLAGLFWGPFDAWCAEQTVVSEFVRFALDPSALLPFPGHTESRALNVTRSLDLSPESLWMDAEHKVRKNVRRARESGVTVETDETGKRLGAFLEVYEATMERRGARAHYSFARSYYEAIHRDLAGQFVYAFALHAGQVVSAELALVSAEALYSFLGGTRAEAFALRPNDLLKVELMRWGQERGKRAFVLGGGYTPGDGIYRYKASFAPSGSVPFVVGTRVHDAARYAALVARRRAHAEAADEAWEPAADFFPAYRA